MPVITEVPNLVYSDGEGNIYDAPGLWMAGRSGMDIVSLDLTDFIELPDGSELFELPNRYPLGFDKETGNPVVCKDGIAVAAFMAPAHTMFYSAAYQKMSDAQTLPLFAYTAVGFLNGRYYVPATRVDPDVRQEPLTFDQEKVIEGVDAWISKYPSNRLLMHIGENCAKTYHCPAARNFFLGRFEAPIPTSPACNANCVGCISFQPEEENIPATQDRLTIRPTVDEIIEYTIPHLDNVEDAVVSFGQGCEGEPLLMWQVIRDSIIEMRKRTQKGIININTNASMPQAVEELCKAGLNSIRISTNSLRKEIYTPYYKPNNYSFEALADSARIVRKFGGWTSINYFALPGMTDNPAEYEALRKFIRDTDLCMIQWRNFNIDVDWYFEKIGIKDIEEGLGIKHVMQLLKEEFPHLAFGYFNPPLRVQQQYNALRPHSSPYRV